MNTNPVLDMLGRRLRLGVIGGAPGSFIGAVHRMAAKLDDCYELVCGVMSSRPEKALKVSREMGFAADRQYGRVDEMLEKELSRQDPIDLVAIMTPNDSHFTYSMAALEQGMHVICDKPMTNTLENARTLHEKVLKTGKIFCLTHNYTGYPLVRQARAMVLEGLLGDIRLIQVEYVQGGRAKAAGPNPARAWKYDPGRSGPSLVMGDIGSHAHNIIRFVTGLEVASLSANLGSIVPGRQVHDFAAAMLNMNNGARAVFWVTQAAAGIENSLKFRISGAEGSLEWFQEIPQRLHYYPLDQPARVLTPGGPETLALAMRASRIARGHPEGFIAGFANIYRDAAEAIAAQLTSQRPDPLALHFPNSEDGLRGIEFIHAALESSGKGGSSVALH